MRTAGYIVAAVLSVACLGCAGMCSAAAGRNHLSPWWIPAYASMLLSFALVAFGTSAALA